MSESINISPVVADSNTQRLNYIPGRTLSEQEFDLMQVYVDERCEDLLLAQKPGIVEGLDLVLPTLEPDETLADVLDKEPVQINSGIGISYSGKVITNRLPIRFYWQDLLDQYLAEQTLLNNVDDGIYFLTLRRKILVFEESQRQDPNTRTELNPLRDTRLETLAQVSLQPVWYADDLFDQSRQRIAVSILQTMIETESFEDNPDQIKLALVKIKDQKPQWIDKLAGRFLARENPVHFTLMDYWHAIVNSANLFRLEGDAAVIKPEINLHELLDIDCLPAAGQFPVQLITNLAGTQHTTPELWIRPTLNFNPDGLQIEIVPIPENTIKGTLQAELDRGVIDLNPGSLDRLRIMVAVNQNDYHPKLMDLPEIDSDLIKEYLLPKQQEVVKAYINWESAYYDLYGGLKSHIKLDTEDKKKKTLEHFSSIYLTNVTENAFSGISDDNKKLLRIPQTSTPKPSRVHETLQSLVHNKQNIRPYSLINQVIGNVSNGDAVPVVTDKNGKMYERIDTKDDIEVLEDFLLRANQLIDEVRDYLSLQRQQLDSMTVGFSSMAGGIPGDGTGLKLMRWSDKLTLTNKLVTTGGS